MLRGLCIARPPRARPSLRFSASAITGRQDVVEQHYWDMPGNVRVLGQIDLMFARRDSPLFDAYGRAMNLLVGRKASHHRRVGRRAARRALAGLLP